MRINFTWLLFPLLTSLCQAQTTNEVAKGVAVSNTPTGIVNTATEPVAPGKFAPTWESLKQYECPQWFRDAKFGIWSVRGSQAVPEQGDWYARNMYFQGHRRNVYQVTNNLAQEINSRIT